MTDNRRIADAWIQGVQDGDVAALAALMHPDIVVTYPQSGEVIRGRENYVAMLSNFPGGLPPTEVDLLIGGEESVQVFSPLPFSIPTVTVTGSGDRFIAEGLVEYPDAGLFHFASIVKVHDGKIAEETDYFAAPFEAPEWRRPYVEPPDESAS